MTSPMAMVARSTTAASIPRELGRAGARAGCSAPRGTNWWRRCDQMVAGAAPATTDSGGARVARRPGEPERGGGRGGVLPDQELTRKAMVASRRPEELCGRRIGRRSPPAGVGEDSRGGGDCGSSRPSQHLRVGEDGEEDKAQLRVGFDLTGRRRSSGEPRRRGGSARCARGKEEKEEKERTGRLGEEEGKHGGLGLSPRRGRRAGGGRSGLCHAAACLAGGRRQPKSSHKQVLEKFLKYYKEALGD